MRIKKANISYPTMDFEIIFRLSTGFYITLHATYDKFGITGYSPSGRDLYTWYSEALDPLWNHIAKVCLCEGLNKYEVVYF